VAPVRRGDCVSAVPDWGGCGEVVVFRHHWGPNPWGGSPVGADPGLPTGHEGGARAPRRVRPPGAPPVSPLALFLRLVFHRYSSEQQDKQWTGHHNDSGPATYVLVSHGNNYTLSLQAENVASGTNSLT